MVAVARPLSAPEMFNQLDVHVIGQDRAKKQLCSALYNHQLGLRYRLHPQSEGRTLGLHHRLIAGPTGVGKSLLIMIAGRILDVPVAWVSSTSLVETGYVGQPVESVLVALLDAAEGDLERAEQGIIMLDEFDKLRRALDVGRDVSGEGVQRGLLTLLDGRRTKIKYRERDVWIDTSRILFLAAGAFEGITTLVAQRLAREVHPLRPLGFVSKRPDPRLYSEADLWAHVLPEDIVQFGFLRELVGRFAGIITLDPLTKPDLLRLLNEAPHSPLRMKRDFFEMHGIALEFEDEFLSMRPFRCIKGVKETWCHIDYPYELKRLITPSDLADLEYALLFLFKPPAGYSISTWNGLYFKLAAAEDGAIFGTMHDVNLEPLGVPADDPAVRLIQASDLSPADPGTHRFARIEI